MTAQATLEGQTVLISSFRNEAPFVLEFVAHHKVLGFDHIAIASNDCTDGTAEILDALDAMGVITHVPCAPPPNITPLNFAWAEIRRKVPLDRAEWLMIMDADELLNIHVGSGRISDLILVQEPGTDLVLVNWACFGTSGHQRWVDEPSSLRFTHRMRTLIGAGLVKSLIRHPKMWKTLSSHHPFGFKGPGPVRIGFAGGVRVEDVAADALAFGTYRNVKPQVGSFRIAQINHYATRTEDSFDLRRARGAGAQLLGKANQRHNDDYFQRMSGGSFLDDTIFKYADAVGALTQVYRQNARLAQALDGGLRHYEAEIARYWHDRASG